jgi:secreted PhoX family phosphatase
MGDDGTPGCIYKFVPSGKVNPRDRRANANLLDAGTLHVARFEADGTGRWIALEQGRNGLVPGATDPGNTTQGPQTPTRVNFASQADVLVNTKSAARVAGGTLMDRPEWISVAPDGSVFCTLTNNSGRAVTDAANPRVQNRHGHIVRWRETAGAPDATTFGWELVLQAGDPTLATATGNLVGDIVGDTFSSPDGIGIDPAGRAWVQTDMSVPGSSGVSGITNVAAFGHNAMYHLDPATRRSSRFLVGPVGCEITGLTWTPDLRTFFVNVQHPTGAWPSNVQGNALPARSATVVVRRTDGRPVGA